MSRARFESTLVVEKIGPRDWILVQDLIFYSIRYHGYVIAPAGFQTNFASIPRVLWALLPPVDRYDPAAVIHDAGYANALRTWNDQRIFTVKRVADDLFREGLIVCGVNRYQAWGMYQAVKHFGDAVGHPLAENAKIRSDGDVILTPTSSLIAA